MKDSRKEQVNTALRNDVFACPSPKQCRKDCRFFNEGAKGKFQCMQDFAIIYGKQAVEWADQNPESKYNMTDPDLVQSQLETIVNTAERTTSGNVAHNIASIRLLAKCALNVIKRIKDEM